MKKQITRKELVMQSALKMVAGGGFHASPMSELASVSGVAVGTIYHHFASKEELLAALYARCKENMLKAMTPSLESNTSFSKKFEAIWKSLYQYFIKNADEFSFLEQYYNSPGGAHTSEGSAIQSKPVLDFFKDGVKSGKMKKLNVDVLSEWFYGLVATAVKMHFSGSTKKLSSKDVDLLVEMSWNSVKK